MILTILVYWSEPDDDTGRPEGSDGDDAVG